MDLELRARRSSPRPLGTIVSRFSIATRSSSSSPVIELQHERLRQIGLEWVRGAAKREARSDEDSETNARVALFVESGGLIANVPRLRKIVRRLQGDSEMRIARNLFESQVSRFESARHHLEHLDTAIPQIASTGHPAFGSISWWTMMEGDELIATMVIPGTIAVSRGAATVQMPSSMEPPVDHFLAVIGGENYPLSEAARAVAGLERRLRHWSLNRSNLALGD